MPNSPAALLRSAGRELQRQARRRRSRRRARSRRGTGAGPQVRARRGSLVKLLLADRVRRPARDRRARVEPGLQQGRRRDDGERLAGLVVAVQRAGPRACRRPDGWPRRGSCPWRPGWRRSPPSGGRRASARVGRLLDAGRWWSDRRAALPGPARAAPRPRGRRGRSGDDLGGRRADERVLERLLQPGQAHRRARPVRDPVLRAARWPSRCRPRRRRPGRCCRTAAAARLDDQPGHLGQPGAQPVVAGRAAAGPARGSRRTAPAMICPGSGSRASPVTLARRARGLGPGCVQPAGHDADGVDQGGRGERAALGVQQRRPLRHAGQHGEAAPGPQPGHDDRRGPHHLPAAAHPAQREGAVVGPAAPAAAEVDRRVEAGWRRVAVLGDLAMPRARIGRVQLLVGVVQRRGHLVGAPVVRAAAAGTGRFSQASRKACTVGSADGAGDQAEPRSAAAARRGTTARASRSARGHRSATAATPDLLRPRPGSPRPRPAPGPPGRLPPELRPTPAAGPLARGRRRAAASGAACAPRLCVRTMICHSATFAAARHGRPLWQRPCAPGHGACRRSACRGPEPARPWPSRL